MTKITNVLSSMISENENKVNELTEELTAFKRGNEFWEYGTAAKFVNSLSEEIKCLKSYIKGLKDARDIIEKEIGENSNES